MYSHHLLQLPLPCVRFPAPVPDLQTPGAEGWRDAVGSSYPEACNVVKCKTLLRRLDIFCLSTHDMAFLSSEWLGVLSYLKAKGQSQENRKPQGTSAVGFSFTEDRYCNPTSIPT